jgi:RNA polymerase sigma factor (sigma-70 family)
MGRNVFSDRYPAALRQPLAHAKRFNELLRRVEADAKRHTLVGRAGELRLLLRAAVDEWRAGKRSETETVNAITGHLDNLHRTVGRALGVRRLECCRGGAGSGGSSGGSGGSSGASEGGDSEGGDTTGGGATTTSGCSLALSVALGAATASASNATEQRGWQDSAEVLRRFYDELGLVEQEARAVSRRVPAFRATVDELRAFGLEGLLEAARRFDATRGVPFAPWARRRIRSAMLDGVRSAAGSGRDPRAVAIAHAAPTPAPTLERKIGEAEELAQMLALLTELGDAERRLLERRYVDGESLSKAAEALGLPVATASRMHGRALASLRRQLRPSDTG